MKTININGAFTIEELTDFLEKIKKKKHWTEKLVQPNKEEYYYIEQCSENCFIVHESSYPNHIIKPKHAFRTKKQAQLVADKCILMVEMHNFAYSMNDGWTPDWENKRQDKWGITFSSTFDFTYSNIYNDLLFGIAVKSEEIARQMFEEFKQRLEIYNKQF